MQTDYPFLDPLSEEAFINKEALIEIYDYDDQIDLFIDPSPYDKLINEDLELGSSEISIKYT